MAYKDPIHPFLSFRSIGTMDPLRPMHPLSPLHPFRPFETKLAMKGMQGIRKGCRPDPFDMREKANEYGMNGTKGMKGTLGMHRGQAEGPAPTGPRRGLRQVARELAGRMATASGNTLETLGSLPLRPWSVIPSRTRKRPENRRGSRKTPPSLGPPPLWPWPLLVLRQKPNLPWRVL